MAAPAASMIWPVCLACTGGHKPAATSGSCWGRQGKLPPFAIQPRLVTDDVITIRRCALEHGGIAQLPLLVCFKDLQQGLLVPVLDDWQPQEAVVFALFPSRQGMLPSVRSLLDFLTDSFGDMDFSNLQAGYAARGDEDACFMR